MQPFHFKSKQKENLTKTIFWICLLILFQLPIVSYFYKLKSNYQQLPNKTNYYNNLSNYFKLRLKNEFFEQNTDSKFKTWSKQQILNIINSFTDEFTRLLYQFKIVLKDQTEIDNSFVDLSNKLMTYFDSESNVDFQESINLSKLSNFIQQKHDSNLTKLQIQNENFINSSDNTCPMYPETLVGQLKIDFDIDVPTEEQIEDKFRGKFFQGGHFKNEDCTSNNKVAIIIPYRNRYEHLMYLLWYLHPILQRQMIEYKIYVINQTGTTPFNRAQLLNIGFIQSIIDYKNWDCFIFHDVDLVPENDNMLYTCPELPRHMSVAVDKFRYQLPYSTIFGGATAFKKDHFLKLNGYSNKFTGWGGEDDDMFRRLYLAHIDIQRPHFKIGRYRMIRHVKDESNKLNTNRFKLLKSVRQRWKVDGLSNILETFKLVDIQEHYSFTMINIKVL